MFNQSTNHTKQESKVQDTPAEQPGNQRINNEQENKSIQTTIK